MVEHCRHTRFVYNLGLEQRKLYADRVRRGLRPEVKVTAVSQMHELAQLRRDLDWLRAGSSSVQQAALRDLDRGFTNFFNGTAKYPRFKRKDDRAGSFKVRDLSVRRLNRKWGEVTVPKVGRVRFRVTRPWSAIEAATSGRVTLRHGQWHIALTTERAPTVAATSGEAVGIDRGVANTLALSDGQMLHAPGLTDIEQARFVRLQQQASRQRIGSNRRARTVDKLAVIRRRLSNRRRDWVEQTTTNLARRYSVVALEDLRVASMVRRPAVRPDPDLAGRFLPNGARAKAGLNRAIHASVWREFAKRLTDKMPDGAVVLGDPKNSSRTCAVCGHCAAANRDSQAVLTCEACGHTAHADTNAAINVLRRAQGTMASGHGVSGRGSPALPGSVNRMEVAA
jgi:transposase